MTRFARASKKTSLEATPWHELVNSGGKQEFTESKIRQNTRVQKLLSDSFQGFTHVKICISSLLCLARGRLFNILLIGDHGSTTNMAGKKTKMAGKKRKKNLNSDEETVHVAFKVSRKSENEKIQSVGVEDEANVRTVPKKKDSKKGNKAALNSIKYNGIMKKKKKHGPKSDMHMYKNIIKHESKSPTNANRTEGLDKKLEARRKRRAKRKVVIKLLNFISKNIENQMAPHDKNPKHLHAM